MSPFGITVEVLGGERDLDGDLHDEQPVGTITGAAFAPGTSTEDNDRKSQVVTTGTLYVPPGAFPVTAQHRIRFPGGAVWTVDGAPGTWSNPLTGWSAGGEIRLRRVTG
jgi:hypothetical protein